MDDVLIKDGKDETKNLILTNDGYHTLIKEYIEDIKSILKRLEEINLTLFLQKSIFGFKEIMIIRHLCKSYGRKVNLDKINVITRIKACRCTTKVSRFLGACLFYHIWILHYDHVAKPLY